MSCYSNSMGQVIHKRRILNKRAPSIYILAHDAFLCKALIAREDAMGVTGFQA